MKAMDIMWSAVGNHGKLPNHTYFVQIAWMVAL
jgi:hypothetical protein